MSPAEIVQLIKEKFPSVILQEDLASLEPNITVNRDEWRPLALFLRDDSRLDFKALMCLSGMDYKKDLGVVYHLHSMTKMHRMAVKMNVTREDAELPTVSDIWRTADWHEREVYDLYGIVFINHPDLRRILLPDDWQGYPLRKDYVTPEMYNDMPVPYQGP